MFNQEAEKTSAPQDFFCGSTPEEVGQLPRKEPLYKTLSAPISAQVELTEACNVFCQHCYNYWRREDASFPATLKEAHLLQVIRELIDKKSLL